MITAALAALPLIQQAEKGLAKAVGQGVSQLVNAGNALTGGQNVPTAQHKSPAQFLSQATSAKLGAGVMGALIALQAGSSSSSSGG